MSKRSKVALLSLLSLGALLLIAIWLHGHNFAVLNPKGTIAQKELRLITTTLLLSLIVVIPVFIMTFGIAWKYRESNTKAKYKPDWDHSLVAETIWWTVPLILILILAGITWKSSHELDPFKPVSAKAKAMTVQVVALDWKWLFIYPEQHIATVNYVQFPEQTPLDFEITADAPMNSFWIPQLGGQIYAMAGMSTYLHLMASGVGSYQGSSANLSGRGFAGMRFTAKSTTPSDFEHWARSIRQSSKKLGLNEYAELARPSEHNKPAAYSLSDENLYDTIVMKYMLPVTGSQPAHSSDMP